MAALSEILPVIHKEVGPPIPPVPKNLEEAGIAPSLVEQLIFKFLYYRGELSGRDLADLLGMQFSAIDGLLDSLKLQHLVQVKRSSGFGNVSAEMALTEAGRNRARDCLETNQYLGPVPVPLTQYADFVRLQRLEEGWLSPAALLTGYRHMSLSPRVLSLLGPAVNAGSSFLVYGMPGDGKSYMAENLTVVANSPVYVPFALECQGNIVQVFDPIYHIRMDDSPDQSAVTHTPMSDRRWARCRRPFLVTGGELSLDMLDLSFNPTSKIYDAPFQLKANNGIYLIDDFGRQRATPAEVLNRWIVPMERRVDYLSFRSGGKMTVPFECFLVFSTNLNPARLGDEAFLRRIQYKLHLHRPGEMEFLDIFRRFCMSKGLACPTGLAERFVQRRYRPVGKPFRRCHPRDIVSHAINMIQFDGLPYELNDELLDRAFASCFVEESDEEASVPEPWKPPPPAIALMPPEASMVAWDLGSRPAPRGSWESTLENIKSLFGRLLLYSSLRDAANNRYSEPTVTAQSGPVEADRILRGGHVQAFSEWVACTISQQRSDLEGYRVSLAGTRRDTFDAWLRERQFHQLIPQGVNEQDRRLYLADMESLRDTMPNG